MSDGTMRVEYDEARGENMSPITVTYEGKEYHMVVWWDMAEAPHFYYLDGEKPDSPDFENKVIARL